MAFDRRAGRLVALANAREGIQTWTLDVCANTWTRMHPNEEPWWMDWSPLIYDIDSDATVLIAKGRVWAYDLQANTWTPKRAAPTGNTAPWAYDPLSGLIVATDYGNPVNLWDYDVETDMWTPIHQTNLPDSSPPYAVYDTSVDRITTYGPWRLDIRTGTWSTSGTETPRVIAGYGMQAPRIEYDEAAKRMVVFGNGQLAVYDATADRWEVLVEADIGGSLPLSMVYDAVNGRLVGLWASTAVQDGVVAFDLVARKRTLLLEPSDGRPAPSFE